MSVLEYDLENFVKYANNKHSLSDYPRQLSDTVLRIVTCCLLRSRFDRMSDAARRHTHRELDVSRIILKQRMLSNVIYSLTTPFQRRLCRH
jgi:hypothetical protein